MDEAKQGTRHLLERLRSTLTVNVSIGVFSMSTSLLSENFDTLHCSSACKASSIIQNIELFPHGKHGLKSVLRPTKFTNSFETTDRGAVMFSTKA